MLEPSLSGSAVRLDGARVGNLSSRGCSSGGSTIEAGVGLTVRGIVGVLVSLCLERVGTELGGDAITDT